MMIFVRHGKTASNEVGHEKLRGWLPVPLTLEGMQAAEEVGQMLAGVEDITVIKCATLVRVVQTASEIAEHLEMVLTPMEELNDWHTGAYAGQSVQDTLDDLHDHIKHPLKAVKGGETFQFFLDRIIPVLTEAIESDEVEVVVSSGRVGTLIKALCANKGKHPSTDILLGKPPIDPSGIMVIDKKWNIVFKTTKDEESKGLS